MGCSLIQLIRQWSFSDNDLANPVVGKRLERHQTHGGPEAVALKPIARHGSELLLLTGRDRCSAGFRFLTAPISMPLTTCVARDSLANPGCGKHPHGVRQLR